VRALGVVMDEPFIKVFLKGFYGFIEVFPEGNAEKLIQYRLVKTLNKAVGLW
jgi:hypothetical protein